MKRALVLSWLALLATGADAGVHSAIVSVYPVAGSRGLLVTSGGWAYCEQLRALALRARYTLMCGRYAEDGYVGPGLRAQRHLDWGNEAYLAEFAKAILAEHVIVGGRLVLMGVSYSGFAVATLASHHPDLRPDRLIVLDSFLDLVARRAKLPPNHPTAREIDAETGGSREALLRRSVDVDGLARLLRQGTRLTIVWSIASGEKRFFAGATCDRTANAETLARLARTLGEPIEAHVTLDRHGHDLWDFGARILAGFEPGRRVVFEPDGAVPAASTCE